MTTTRRRSKATSPGLRSSPAMPAPPRVRRKVRSLLWRGRFVLAALTLGAAAGITVHQLSPPRPAAVSLVVIDRLLPAGTLLVAGDLRTVDLDPAVVPADAVRKIHDAVGRTLAVNATPGTIVSAPVLSRDLASQAPAGTVIAAVRLAEPALAGLLEPGMRLDLLSPAPQHAGADPSPDAQGQAAPATYLARGAVVQPVPRPAAGPQGDGVLSLGADEPDGDTDIVLVAVTPDEAASLANMTGWSAISAVLVH